MAELRKILPERLSELFDGETQQVTATKLHTQQGTVSKWLSGDSIPPTETLLYIAKMYRVSVDWLLGLSEEKDVDAVSIKKLTYEQVSLVLHRLIELGSIEIPDLNQFEPAPEEDDSEEEREPKYDSDFIKINDRALSFILRRRWSFFQVDEDSIEYWLDSVVKKFNGVRMLTYNQKIEDALDSQSWSVFKPGDWASLLRQLGEMDEAQIETMANKNKDGQSNG